MRNPGGTKRRPWRTWACLIVTARKDRKLPRRERTDSRSRPKRKFQNRAAEKQKECFIGHILAINRPPLRGVWEEHSGLVNSEQCRGGCRGGHRGLRLCG